MLPYILGNDKREQRLQNSHHDTGINGHTVPMAVEPDDWCSLLVLSLRWASHSAVLFRVGGNAITPWDGHTITPKKMYLL